MMGDLLIVLSKIVGMVLGLYQWILFAAVIISWIRPSPDNEVVRSIIVVIGRLTDPVFAWVRQKLPRSFFASGMDFTPMIVWFGLVVIDMVVTTILRDAGIRLMYGVTPPLIH